MKVRCEADHMVYHSVAIEFQGLDFLDERLLALFGEIGQASAVGKNIDGEVGLIVRLCPG